MSPLVRWVEMSIESDKPWRRWELMVGRRKQSAATVWGNGVWHTWNRDGIGGENSSEASVKEAKVQAAGAAIMQGFV